MTLSFFPSSVCAVALLNTAIWTTVQSQLGNTAQIYHKIVKTANRLQKSQHTSHMASLKFPGKNHGPAKEEEIFITALILKESWQWRGNLNSIEVIYNKTISSQARLCDSIPSASYFSLSFWIEASLHGSWHIWSSGHIKELFCETLKHCLR